MKKILTFLTSMLLPLAMFAAAGDIKIDRKNSSDNAWISTIFAKQNGALMVTGSTGIPQLIAAGA